MFEIKTKIKFLVWSYLCFLFLFVLTSNVLAGSAALSWQANTEQDLAGYKIYWGTSPRTGTKPSDAGNGGYANVVNAGNVTTYTINNIPDTGTAYFSVTAYDNASSPNESDFSAEAKKTPGDVDKNGTVNIFDYNSLKDHFGESNCGNLADIDLSCDVDIFDYNVLKGNFGDQAG